MITRRITRAVAALSLILVVSSCSLRPEDLPSVRGGIGDGYEISVEFASVMNLPSGADVIMDGVRVGEVRNLEVQNDGVAVRVGVRSDTRVPADVRAIVRQNTLLGDTYVALLRNPDGRSGEYLGEGATVPVERTTSPPQLEDTMAVLATFVNGGSIRRIEQVMGRVNAVMPDVAEIERLAGTVAVDLNDLGQRTVEIDRMLDGMNSSAAALNDNSESLVTIFDGSSVHYWRRLAVDVVSHIGQILPSVGSLYVGGYWLVPMFESLADTTDISRGGPSATVELSNFLRTTLIPFAQNPSVDIVSVESAGGDQLVSDAENILRMLGAVQ
ncbi:MlaD family protein [Rhodococcus rhodochrous]|uniref:MlaD family protein n=1 Tax=Rhodococcus rhodochrous TaxID=1829 RepID=A0AAW4XFI7_RHORH|nr:MULTISPECIES: MlaD family protein [Rhodococcus]MCD2111629.1 MlaD family protein [Rhodococcus rhodochrous]WAL46017.1 MlaD family protein [Rhodococcus pyridinivorans]